MSLHFDAEKNRVLIHLTGEADARKLLATLDRVVGHEDCRPGMARLWDLRDVTFADDKVASIAEMARYSAGLPPGYGDVKIAFVADRAMAFGLARMFEAYTNGDRVGVFSTMPDAEAWLDG